MTTTHETVAAMMSDPATFQESVIIPSGHRGPARFGSVMADFQRERFGLLNPALVALRDGTKPPIGRHWWEATKGASKDSDLAVCILWLLAATRRPLTIQVGAADRDQADELRKAAKATLHLNPWLRDVIDCQSWSIVNTRTGSTCEIIAADVTGSHGARPDVLVLNELSHVAKREFAENLMDNAAKVPNGLAIIATNAGHLNTWQYEWRQMAQESIRWAFHVRNCPAPWIDENEMADARRRNSPARFARLWGGVWSTGEEGALNPEDVEAAITLPGPMPMYCGEWAPYFGSLDLGVKRDASALVVVGCDVPLQRFRLAYCRSWKASRPGAQVDLQAVRDECETVFKRFDLSWILFDPHQAYLMAQELAGRGVRMHPITFSPKNLDAMACNMMELFASRRLDLFRDEQLISDLMRLQIVERNLGHRLVPQRDEHGHGDRAIALSMVLPQCVVQARYMAYRDPHETTFDPFTYA